ncbi:PilZ domain-containing protein [Paenibacillus abyssi]|uniref:PilZ domain-containing protein n=1 Tax=Paenibacillus abyssi TaxID=1340531 RepID=A0A917G4G6_9BACL|nr:PilZ domain-containing protein [Paenibacillus abyssi]GGG21779.1 hypothetical protein GCM10010916_43090 [Paenibacillus abyssi]
MCLKGDKRQHVRLQMTHGLMADLRIIAIRNEPVKTKPCRVLIKDLSPNGLSFLTILDFPVNSRYMLQLELDIPHLKLELSGQVRWRMREDNLYCYGMMMTKTPSSRCSLLYALNHLLLQQSPTQSKIHKLYRTMSAFH